MQEREGRNLDFCIALKVQKHLEKSRPDALFARQLCWTKEKELAYTSEGAPTIY